MSIRFAIKNTALKAEKEGDVILRYSGVSEPFRRRCERSSKKIGVDGKGEARILFETGLDEKKVQFYAWYTDAEKKEVRDSIKQLKATVEEYYGGAEVVEPSNRFFWKDDRNVNVLSLTNADIDVFYDTEKPAHALLYLSIISGAFIELVSPTKDWAERHQVPHYMVLETDTSITDDDDVDYTRAEAQAALMDLKKNEGKDALYILAWCLQYDTNAFGAYNYSVSEKDLLTYHIKYINGKLTTKRKKNMPKLFIEYAERWKGQQTRPLLYAEAYVKAGEYFNFISQKEKKYVTSDGTVLGNTYKEAVDSLVKKPSFAADFEKLRDLVEAKWNE